MNRQVVGLVCAIASAACASSPVSFQTHYISLGSQDKSVAIVSDAGGDLFVVSATSFGIRVTKTDPSGNVLAVFDFGQGVTPTGAAVDPQGNLLVAGKGLVAKLDNGLANILATSSIGGTAVGTDASGNVYVAGANLAVGGANVLVGGANPAVAGVKPAVAGVNPAVAGVTPAVAGVKPAVAGVKPAVAGVNPAVAGVNPAVAGVNTAVAGVNPAVAGVTPAVAGVNPAVAGVNLAVGGANLSVAMPGAQGPAAGDSIAAGAGYTVVAELSPDLSTVIHTAIFGSSAADCDPVYATCRQANGPGLPASTTATAIAIDPSGAVVIAGYTNGTPAQLFSEPYNYGFVAKFSSGLSSVTGSAVFNPRSPVETYFRAMTLDQQGNVLLVGRAGDIGSIPGGTLQPVAPPGGGGIVLEYDSTLENILWGTFFGTSVDGVGMDSQGSVWITGNSDLPFVAEVSRDGSATMNMVSSQFGGAAVTVLPNGGVAVLGSTDSFLMSGPPDQPSLLMVANSANNQSSGTIAPAELISLYGTGIGPATPLGGVVSNGAFTNSLGGYQVLFNGIPAPLLYLGPNQINLVAPTAIANQQTAHIEVVGPSSSTTFPTVFVSAARPQIFSQVRSFVLPFTNATETASFAIAYNQDGTLNSESNPAPKGSIVTIWATGTGLAGDPLPDGAIGTSAATVNLPVAIPGMQVPYAGQAPGAIQGLTQINVQIPSDAFIFGPTQLGISFQLGGATTAIAEIEVTTN